MANPSVVRAPSDPSEREALQVLLDEALNLIEHEAGRIDCTGSADGLVERARAALAGAVQAQAEPEVYEIERDRHGLMYSGPLAVGECVRVVPLDKAEGSPE